ncbi:MAG: SsrA-binding protein SmpB [Bacteroidales bacterium]|nr:SsrA-binding protein SmpB [Bacteroidales bacterium]MBN2758699.1 SsrA-binding protein SmpB [Bacteroidales bacterium]
MNKTQDIVIKNKKARFQYEILEVFTAGMELYGTEIKAIRDGKASLVDAYCHFITNPQRPQRPELYIRMHISEYTFGSYNNHDPKRERKLLLQRRELNKISKKVKATGLTIVPLKLFINNTGIAKIEIAIAKGKKAHDKREDIKDKDSKRELDRIRKN